MYRMKNLQYAITDWGKSMCFMYLKKKKNEVEGINRHLEVNLIDVFVASEGVCPSSIGLLLEVKILVYTPFL